MQHRRIHLDKNYHPETNSLKNDKDSNAEKTEAARLLRTGVKVQQSNLMLYKVKVADTERFF